MPRPARLRPAPLLALVALAVLAGCGGPAPAPEAGAGDAAAGSVRLVGATDPAVASPLPECLGADAPLVCGRPPSPGLLQLPEPDLPYYGRR